MSGRRRRKPGKGPTRSKAHQLPSGIFEANPRGFGFVKTPEGAFFVPESKAGDAMDGDLVEVARVHRRGRPSPGHDNPAKRDEARVVRVLERRHSEILGRYEVAEPFGVVIPDDPRMHHDVFTLRASSPDVPDGAIVRVRILEYPTRKSAATGEVVEVLGQPGDEGLLVERVIARHDLETRFSEEALAEAASLSVDVEGALRSGYRDIRDRFVFTIDPEDAKDFDDALSLEEIGEDRYRLGIHIADVSSYVPWSSSIDMEARQRATSVYLVDRVIPMLPPSLADDLCSLRPGVDRLCMTVDLVVNGKAEVIESSFYPAVMRSNARLTYDEALSLLEGGTEASGLSKGESWEDFPVEKLLVCSRLAKARARHRESLGGIEFKTKEAKVALGERGEPVGIVVREKNDATELIEEAMVFANEVVASRLSERDVPCAYRVHDVPACDSLAALVPTLQEFKWFGREDAAALKTGSPFAIQRILRACAGRAEEELVTMIVLRAMMRAVYSPRNTGHYGLGLGCYCHFTSPIRRYPDLIVHRMLKASIGLAQPDAKGQAASLPWLCEHSSDRERKAEAAALDSQKVKMAEYMEAFLGERFDGIVTGVATYGLYVRLDNCVEGLVPIRTLGDEYFLHDEDRHMLKGVDSGVTYRLGQPVCVRLTSVDVDRAYIDFKLVV